VRATGQHRDHTCLKTTGSPQPATFTRTVSSATATLLFHSQHPTASHIPRPQPGWCTAVLWSIMFGAASSAAAPIHASRGRRTTIPRPQISCHYALHPTPCSILFSCCCACLNPEGGGPRQPHPTQQHGHKSNVITCWPNSLLSDTACMLCCAVLNYVFLFN
jgi:hypothetical protein